MLSVKCFLFAVKLIAVNLPDEFAERLAHTVAQLLTSSHHIEFYLEWAVQLLNHFGQKDNVLSHTVLLQLHQGLNRKYEMLSKV